MDMRYGTWNMRSLYRAGSLVRVSKELSNYKLGLVGCMRSDERALAPNQQENTHFSAERGMRIMNWAQVFVHKRIISAVKRV
jgi:hypothetical protein